jgi:hypothetical protein
MGTFYHNILNMVGVGRKLPHDVHSVQDGPLVAFGAITRLTETGMPWHRFVLMAVVTWSTGCMTVGEPVFMTGGAYAACLVTISCYLCIMLAVFGMADIAYAVIRCDCPGVICTDLLLGKFHRCPADRFSELTICAGSNHVLNHEYIAVTVRVMAIPAELASLPDMIHDFICISKRKRLIIREWREYCYYLYINKHTITININLFHSISHNRPG